MHMVSWDEAPPSILKNAQASERTMLKYADNLEKKYAEGSPPLDNVSPEAFKKHVSDHCKEIAGRRINRAIEAEFHRITSKTVSMVSTLSEPDIKEIMNPDSKAPSQIFKEKLDKMRENPEKPSEPDQEQEEDTNLGL